MTLVRNNADCVNSPSAAPALPTIEDPLEKALLKMGIAYGVLMRLGFSEDRTLECMRTIPNFELDDAFDWVRSRDPK